MDRITRLTAFAVLLCVALPSQATIISYETTLGPEVAGATGSGYVTVDYDTINHTLEISSMWSGLTGTTTAAHIHCCTAVPDTGTAGVAVTPGTLPGFPAGVTMGSYDSLLINLANSASYTASFFTSSGGTLAGAENALIAGFDGGYAYFNIHTAAFPGGEIRGFLAAVPEPATLALTALGLAGIGYRRRQL